MFSYQHKKNLYEKASNKEVKIVTAYMKEYPKTVGTKTGR